MVTLALYAAGAAIDSAILASAGQAGATVLFGFANVGALAGSYIDSRWLGPLLAADPPKQKYLTQDIQGADDGQPMVRCWGETNRFAGQVLWLSELIGYDRDINNGKGGSGGNAVEHLYSCSVEVGICEGVISRVLKVWADGKLIYDISNAGFDVTSDDISGEAYTLYSQGFGSLTYRHRLRMTAPEGGTDLSALSSGKKVLMSGWGSTENNRQATVISTGAEPDGSTYALVGTDETVGGVLGSGGVYSFPSPTLEFATEAAGADVHLLQGYLAYSLSVARRFTFYNGTETQLADPYVEAVEGGDRTTGYRGVARMFIEELQLFDFGNRLPNFTFLVEKASSQTVGDAIAEILRKAGRTDDEFDVSLCTSIVRGFATEGYTTAASDIGPLLLANDIVVSERPRPDGIGTRLVFTPRASIVPIEIDAELLGAHPYGAKDDSPQLVRTTIASQDALISDTIVRYVDPESDYQPGSQRAVRSTVAKRVVQSLDLPVVLSEDEAKSLALRSLWISAAGSRQLDIVVPFSLWSRIHDGDILTFTAQGRDWAMLVRLLDRGANMLLFAKGTSEQQHLSSLSSTGSTAMALVSSAGSGSQFASFYAPELAWVVMDCHAIDNAHTTMIGYYVACSVVDPANRFAGASVFESLDGVNYELVARINQEGRVGETTTVLGPAATCDTWDESQTFDVQMYRGSLESVTDEECLAGKNRMSINGGLEVIGFVNAVHQGGGVYRLSRLLRGRNYTEVRALADGHARGSVCVHLNAGGVQFRGLNAVAIGQFRYVKVVPAGGIVSEYTAGGIVPQGLTVKQPTVCNVVASRDGSSDLTVTWLRRTRSLVRLLSTVGAPRIEPEEEYTVEVLDASLGETVVRTVVVDTPEFTYTAAQQSADGYTPGDPITLRINQTSDLVGRGDELTIEV